MKELTSVEIKHWIDENRENLENARFDKAWQIEDFVILKLYVKGHGSKELVIGPGCIFFTSYSIEKPPHPSNFAMLLRKYLKGKWIRKAYQYHLDRILVFEFDEFDLVLEIMKPTIVVLIDKRKKILGISKVIKSKSRGELMMNREYSFPPTKRDILEESKEEFLKIIEKEGVENISKIYGIAPKYVEYALLICGCEIDKIYDLLREMFLEKKVCVCGDEIYGFCLENKKECKRYNSINEAIEEVFIKELQSIEIKEEKRVKRDEKKIEYMKSGLERLIREKEELEKKAEILSLNFDVLEDILNKLAKHQTHEAVKRINYKEKKAEISLEGKRIEIRYDLNAYQNISAIYNNIKKIKEKIKNLENKIAEETEKIKNLEGEEITTRKIKIEKKRKKKWYENFKWFITSQGRVFVLGKDATSNEILIKKYMDKDDIVFHTFVPGSGFGLLKGGREDTNEDELIECAQFTASHSSLWKQMVYSGEVFWVYPEQVSKKAPSGEYLTKGSFMIYGKKNIIKVPLELAFGYDEKNKEIIYGPLTKVIKITKHYAVVIPGDKKASEIIKKIKLKISKNLKKEDAEKVMGYEDEFFRERIPFGFGDVRGKI